ncbi:DNA cytosine methyltransferase, partial [Mycobacterium kansasii]
MLEQVPAVLPVWEAMAEVLETNGYGTDTGVLHTEEFGVPQTRRRAVLIARLGESSEDVQLPKGTHRRYGRTDAQDD